MYNRYIPQADGSYRRSAVSDSPVQRPPAAKPPEPTPCPVPEAPVTPVCKQPCSHQRRCAPPKKKSSGCEASGVGSFFRQLLPRDFSTEDLLIVLLLLLMSGDCPEDQNSALLTLALYLFL